jgi:hypothetical protein
MANHPVKYKYREQRTPDNYKHNWEVMKPFVHFSFKAMTLLAGALIGIVKLLPTLMEHHKNEPPKKDTRIIKI